MTVLFAGQASAYLVLPVGTYQSADGCTLSITRKTDGHTEVNVWKGFVIVRAEFRNPIVSRADQILSISTCKGTTEFKVANEDSVATTYLTRCGGSFEANDYKMFWAVSHSGSDLVAFRFDRLVAKYGTPSGYHSGPIKTNIYPLSCQKFTKVR